jgi:hypothetical protein
MASFDYDVVIIGEKQAPSRRRHGAPTPIHGHRGCVGRIIHRQPLVRLG